MKDFFKSFKYAINGILNTIKEERNMKIHILIMILVITFGVILKISLFEWMICIILFGAVISLELMNTAIEKVVDLACNKENKLAKFSKDAAAGSVLVMALASAIVGVMIFFPKLF